MFMDHFQQFFSYIMTTRLFREENPSCYEQAKPPPLLWIKNKIKFLNVFFLTDFPSYNIKLAHSPSYSIKFTHSPSNNIKFTHFLSNNIKFIHSPSYNIKITHSPNYIIKLTHSPSYSIKFIHSPCYNINIKFIHSQIFLFEYSI